ncbi:hypothetical protein EST38_g4770 [Candolleomyces aberdarensis]|uniref:Uncharacterized protein n=1 Tax=Candolleomyces aberdarensis TaxID=2316362 RepID=A0A4Q2DP27_9AGAR|nr:hypothetical protein EST38_g4770 [Candolleomyces aberdarensis]
MGRNRKHHTTEAVVEAQRDYSKKYYQKNATEINRKRREQYQKARVASTQKSVDERPADPQPPLKGLQFYWVERAATIPDRLNTYLGGKSDHDYIDQVCDNFIKDHTDLEEAKNRIDHQILGIGEIQKSLSRCQGKILNHFGKLTEYNATEPVEHRMANLVRWLQDILAWAMVDTDELITRYKKRQLDFQH